MIVVFRVEVDDRCRRMIAKEAGERGLATRKDIREALEWLFLGYLDDLEHNYNESDRINAYGLTRQLATLRKLRRMGVSPGGE